MPIDEAILYMELYKRKLFNSVSDLDKDIEAYDIAIETMRKYQKIERYMKKLEKNGQYGTLRKLKIVLGEVEDEND